MRMQGLNANGEELSSAFIEHEPVHAPPMDDGRTRQEFKDETDINVILERYETTGILPVVNGLSPEYHDLTEIPTDLLSALQYMEGAQEMFMRLPAKVRREFDNDPVQFAAFASRSENLEQMRDWGLAPKPAAPEKPADAPNATQGGGEPSSSAPSSQSSA